MIQNIDGLKIPPSIDSTAELINRDSVSQTVSGRLIVNIDPNPKWELTASFKKFSLSVAFQAEFYEKCLNMRTQPAQITFVSPYDGTMQTVNAMCTQINTPEIKGIFKKTKTPAIYGNAGAVFQQV